MKTLKRRIKREVFRVEEVNSSAMVRKIREILSKYTKTGEIIVHDGMITAKTESGKLFFFMAEDKPKIKEFTGSDLSGKFV